MEIREKGKYSKKKILKSAQDSFRKHGIDNTTIDDICRNAGLTRGAFYHHFKSKNSLLAALYSNWTAKFAEMPKKLDISEEEPVDIEEFFFKVFEYSKKIFNESKEELPLFLELNILALKDNNLKKYIINDQKNYLNFVTRILSRNKKIINNNVKPEDAAIIIFSLMIGLSIICLQNPGNTDWVNLAKNSIRLMFS
jgi:AcrR family transcriptional regulator